MSALHCRVEPYLIKAAPLRSVAPGPARAGLRPWGADPAQWAGHARLVLYEQVGLIAAR